MGFASCGALHLPFTWRLIGVELSVRVVLIIGNVLLYSLGKPFERITLTSEWQYHSFPHADKETFPVALVVGIFFGITCATAIFWILFMRFKLKASISDTISELIYFLFSLTLALLLVAFFVDCIKLSYGRLRPDYLARCYGDDRSVWPATFPSIPICTNIDSNKAVDGRKSFPSGHSALCWSCSIWLLLYTYQKLCWFKDSASLRIFIPILYTILPLYVSISRTSDYRHYPLDVFAGFLIAVLLTVPPYFLYYPYRWRAIDQFSDALYQKPAVLMTTSDPHMALKCRTTSVVAHDNDSSSDMV